MSEKANVIKIENATPGSFAAAYASLVNTGIGDAGLGSDYAGSIDAEGNFAFCRRRNGAGDKNEYHASITGKVLGVGDDGRLEIAYRAKRSPVFTVSFIVIALLACAFMGWAVYCLTALDQPRTMIPAGFFFASALLLFFDFLIKPDCRALEKHLLKIAGEASGGEE